jgi:hypothetical protein
MLRKVVFAKIKRLFGGAEISASQPSSIDVSRWETVKPLLRVEVRGDMWVSSAAKHAKRKLAENLWLAAVINIEGRFCEVTDEMLATWGSSEEAVLNCGVANLRAAEIDMRWVSVLEGVCQVGVSDAELAAAATLLELANDHDDAGLGLVVAVPSQFAAVVATINPGTSLDDCGSTVSGSARGLYARLQQPISCNIYWYYRGEFSMVPVDRSDGVVYHWPAPLLAAYDALEKS